MDRQRGGRRGQSGGTARQAVTAWARQHPCTIVAAVAAVAALLVWDQLVLSHGTLGPWYVVTHTATYRGPASATPPAGWKPSFRVVVSLSTRPDRMDALLPTVRTVLAQSLKPDAVYINVPRGVNKRFGMPYTVPDDLRHEPGVSILRCDDIGPLTKLLPALEYEQDLSTLIVTVDDDKLYPPNLVATLAWHAAHTENVAVGPCGWSLMWWPRHWASVYVPYFLRFGSGSYVDVLQGVCGVAYKRSFFNTEELRQVPPDCFTIDDEWISGYLATHGVRRAILASPRLDPAERDELSAQTRSFSLSAGNSQHLERYDKCFDLIGERFSPWQRVCDWDGNAPVPLPHAEITIPLPYDPQVHLES